MTLVINMAPEMERRLRDKAAREGLEPERYVLRTVEESLGRADDGNGPHLSHSEAELLDQVDLGVSSETWDRYYALIGKRDDGTLTGEEHGELIGLSDGIEVANARRIGALVELAALRQTSLEELMRALGIPSYTYV